MKEIMVNGEKRRRYDLQDYIYAEAEAILYSADVLFFELAGVTDWECLTPRQKGALMELKRRRLIP